MGFVKTFDATLIKAIQRPSSLGFGWYMSLATFAGNGAGVIVVCVVVSAVYYINGQPHPATAVLVSLGLTGVYNLVKYAFRRRRPDTLYADGLTSSSFPSGHSAGSVAVYSLLGYLLATSFHYPWSIVGIVLAVFVPLSIGTSRVYLGAHYPSDVLGGWLLASLGLIIVIRVFGL